MTNLTLIAAIMAIESGGNDLARGRHGEVGSMQVTRAVVVDVNRHHGTAFTLRSMTNRVAAREVFNRYLSIYAIPSRLGRPVSDEDRARIWNGGPNGWRSRSTLPYLRRYRKEVAS